MPPAPAWEGDSPVFADTKTGTVPTMGRSLMTCLTRPFDMLRRSVLGAVITLVFASCASADDSAPPTTVCLSGSDWRIHDDPDGNGAERGLPLADPATAEWIPAAVPGNIQADLEAAHQLKPLWYGAGDPRLSEAARKDWWYRKDFDVPASFAGADASRSCSTAWTTSATCGSTASPSGATRACTGDFRST